MEDRRRIILEGNVLKTLFLLSIPTIMMATHAVRGNKAISLNTLPAGEYIAKIGSKVVKFSKS